MPEIRGITNSIFNSVTYVLSDGGGDCWLVDCGDADKVLALGLNVRGVLLTHVHFDHIYGLNELIRRFPDMTVHTNGSGRRSLEDPRLNLSRFHDGADFVFERPENVRILSEGDILQADGRVFGVLEVPGHDSSCLAFYDESVIFTGDAHIPGVKVVTGFPSSDKGLAAQSERRILAFSEHRVIFPGHDISNLQK